MCDKCADFFDIVYAQNHASGGSVRQQNASRFYVRISDWADRMCTRKQLNDCDKANNLPHFPTIFLMPNVHTATIVN